jgi:hypothetical protein
MNATDILNLWDLPIDELEGYKVYAKLQTHLVSCRVEKVTRNDVCLTFHTKPVHVCRGDLIKEIQIRNPAGKKVHGYSCNFVWDDTITDFNFSLNKVE